MAVNIKMGVDTSGFKQSIADANAQLKTFDAQLKLAETTMKATGNSEQGLITKTDALNGKLKTQKQMIQQYEKALEDMRKNNVDPLSKEYQKLQTALLNAKTGMVETEAALNGLNGSEQTAISTTNQLTESMNGIGKKISLEQVRSGIKSITDGLESAAQKAVQLGEKLFSVIMESAQQADDIGTMADRLGLTEKEVQQINFNAERFEVTAEQLGKTWKKVKKNMASDNKEIVEGFAELGVQTHQIYAGKYGDVIGYARDYKDVFWETGEALYKMSDAAKQEELAQKLLGRSWDELLPLFKEGREVYEEALENAPTASDEAISNLADLNARMAELESSWNTLKLEALGAIAPALEKGADAIAKLLDKVTEYLKKDAGQELLTKLGNAVSGLFDDLAKISPEDVVNNVTSVLTGLTSGLEWLSNNWEGVKQALIYVVEGWAALKIGGGILDIVKVVGGLADLSGISAAGTAVGSAWGASFGAAVLKAAPWLAGLITLLNPAESQDNSLIGANGITQEGYYEFARQGMEDKGYKEFLMELGTYFGAQGMNSLMGNAAAVTDIWNYLISGKAGYNTQGFVNEVLGQYTGQKFGSDWLGIQFSEEELNEILQSMNPVITPTFLIPENEAETISQEVGTVKIPAELVLQRNRRNSFGIVDAFLGGSHANGLPFVPYDGYLALLHRGERVITASQNKSYTYNNNTYFGSVNLHNGLEIDALTESIARNNRRKSSGYGA